MRHDAFSKLGIHKLSKAEEAAIQELEDVFSDYKE